MKVLFITNYPSPYRVDFFNELGKKCDLTVTFEETPEVQAHRDKSWFHTNYDNFKAVFLKNTLKKKNGHNIISLQIIKEIKKKYDFIIVGVYSTPTSMLAIQYMILNKIPYYIETDGGIVKSGKGFIEKIKKYFISHAKGWFSPSKAADEYLMAYGAKKKRIYCYLFSSFYNKDILENPVSITEKKQLKKRLGMTEEKVIISIGQFIPRKGFDILIKAARKLPKDVGIYIIGGQAPQNYIDLRAKCKLENQVYFVDFKKGEELDEYYKSADLFVLPTREDIWGLVINEAMAKGLPVITTDKCVAGLELVDESNGAIVPVGDVKALSDEMRKFFKLTEDEQLILGQNSLEKIRKYSFENMVVKHIKKVQL